LSALLEQEGGLASSILARAGVNVEALGKKLTGELERLPKVSGGASGIDQIYVTPRLNKLLTAAEDAAAKLKDEYIPVEHVLLAAIDLKDLGVTRERLMQATTILGRRWTAAGSRLPQYCNGSQFFPA
jgi:ATP-dependent Clp protease ATP-binding subunit ClpB